MKRLLMVVISFMMLFSLVGCMNDERDSLPISPGVSSDTNMDKESQEEDSESKETEDKDSDSSENGSVSEGEDNSSSKGDENEPPKSTVGWTGFY